MVYILRKCVWWVPDFHRRALPGQPHATGCPHRQARRLPRPLNPDPDRSQAHTPLNGRRTASPARLALYAAERAKAPACRWRGGWLPPGHGRGRWLTPRWHPATPTLWADPRRWGLRRPRVLASIRGEPVGLATGCLPCGAPEIAVGLRSADSREVP